MNLMQKQRPRGVSIIGWIGVIGGILITVFGLVLATMSDYLSLTEEDIAFFEPETRFLITIENTGIFYVGIGIAAIILGFGLLKGRRWAWPANVIAGFVGIGFSIYYIGAQNSFDNLISNGIAIAIDGVFLYYLYRPHVKAYFGRVASSTATTT